MTAAATQRSVLRVDDPPLETGMTPQHRRRGLITSNDWAAIDPFLRLMEDWFPRGVFDKHPHRGIETVTYVLSGRLDHYDNGGHEGSIGPGEAQWMTAGRGLIHNEIPAEGSTVHSLQLWVNLPAADKMAAPRYQDLTAGNVPVREADGARLRVFSGRSGAVAGPALNHAAVTLVEAVLAPGAEVEQDLPGDYNGFVLVLDGTASVGAGGAPVRAGQIAWLTRGEDSAPSAPSAVRLAAAGGEVRLLVCAGRPLREPVVAYGPFVMNTREQIVAAVDDYNSGRFGA
jgi:redox-sensitive bicupin YhaK (pirin superfamily)